MTPSRKCADHPESLLVLGLAELREGEAIATEPHGHGCLEPRLIRGGQAGGEGSHGSCPSDPVSLSVSGAGVQHGCSATVGSLLRQRAAAGDSRVRTFLRRQPAIFRSFLGRFYFPDSGCVDCRKSEKGDHDEENRAAH